MFYRASIPRVLRHFYVYIGPRRNGSTLCSHFIKPALPSRQLSALVVGEIVGGRSRDEVSRGHLLPLEEPYHQEGQDYNPGQHCTEYYEIEQNI